MNIQRSTPITIARYGRPRNKTQDFEELSSIRSIEPSQSFSPNLGSPSPPETPNLSHCVSCIGKYLLLEPLEGDHVFRAVHLHSGEELVCKVMPLLVLPPPSGSPLSRLGFPCLAGGRARPCTSFIEQWRNKRQGDRIIGASCNFSLSPDNGHVIAVARSQVCLLLAGGYCSGKSRSWSRF